MKKIMMTLCTLLAVNAGSTMYAPPVVHEGKALEGKEPEKSRTETGPERSGRSGRAENGPTQGEIANRNNNQSSSSGGGGKADATNGANTTASSSNLAQDLGIDLSEVQKKSTKLTELNEKKTGRDSSVIHENLNIIKDMNGVKTSSVEPSAGDKNAPKNPRDQTFNLDNASMNVKFNQVGKPTESTQTQTTYEKIGRDKNKTEITKKIKEIKYNSDGSMTETVFKDNPNYSREKARDAKLSKNSNRPSQYNVKETIASHTITYNKDGSVKINRLDTNGNVIESKSLSKEEAQQGLSKKVADKKSSMTDQQETQANENAKTAQENTPERNEAVDRAAEEASKALENDDELGVKAAIEVGVDALVGNRMPAEQKATMIEQITAKIMEIGKAGKQAFTSTIESIRSIINSVFFDFTATTSAPQANLQATNSSTEFNDPMTEFNDANKKFKESGDAMNDAMKNNDAMNNFEDYGDASRSESPTGVADAPTLRSESTGLFKNKNETSVQQDTDGASADLNTPINKPIDSSLAHSSDSPASKITYDSDKIETDDNGTRFHSNEDGSGVFKMRNGILRKFDDSGNALTYDKFDDSVRNLKVVDGQGNLLGRYEVDPQGVVSYPRQFSTESVVPIKDPQLSKTLTELAAKLDAIPVPDNL